MRIVLLVLVFIINSFYGYSQHDELDSLKEVLENHDEQDTIKVKLLLQLSNTVVWSNTEYAMTLASEALNIAEEINWSRGIAFAYRQKGVAYYWASDYVNAVDMNQNALRVGDKLGDETFKVSIYNNLANIYSDLNQYDKALEYYDLQLRVSMESKSDQGTIIALVNRALVYTDLERYAESIDDFENAYDLAVNMGHVYFQSAILNNMGRAYEKMNDNDQAALYYERAVTLATSTDNKTTLASSLNRLANIYINKTQPEKAHKYAFEALRAAEELNSLEGQSDAWKTLSVTYDTLGNETKAYEAFRNHIYLKDSMLSEENKSEITRKEMQFKMEMKEALDSAEIERQTTLKNLAIVGIIILLLGAIVGYLLYKRHRDALEQKQEADFKLSVAETELKVLRSQMNPHFIFNSLNSISDYIEKHDIETANDYLIKFSHLMRLTLENSEKEAVTLSEDLEWIDLYLKLESARLSGKFTYCIAVDEAIDKDNIEVPPMILQPFVENSIWHGLSRKQDGGYIEIKISIEEDMLVCTVDDNGIGRAATQKMNGRNKNSLGVKITENRINILNEIKGTRGKVALTDKEEGLHVEVKLPLELVY